MNMNTLTMVHRMLEEEVKKTDRAYAEARCLYYKAMDEGRTEAADDLRVVKSSLFRKHAYAEAALADFLCHDFFSSFEVYEGPAGPEGEKKVHRVHLGLGSGPDRSKKRSQEKQVLSCPRGPG